MLVLLQISGFKGIDYAVIQPKAGVNRIGGRNGQGKSSATDAILWALTGSKAGIGEPIKVGADQAEVVIDVNGYRITRIKKPNQADSLKVETTDGARMPKPQQFLDAMLGVLNFDPGSFSKASPKDQRRMILDAFRPTVLGEKFKRMTGLVAGTSPLDLDAIGEILKQEEDKRREVGRERKQVEGQLEGFDRDVIVYPTERRSAIEIDTQRKEEEAKRGAIQSLKREITEKEAYLSKLNQTITELGDIRADATRARDNVLLEICGSEAALKNLPTPTEIDFVAQINEIEAHNKKVGKRIEWQTKRNEVAQLQGEYEARTETIEKIRSCASSMAATVDVGVEGLDLASETPTINGVPLGDLSDAEKLKVGVRIAMAQNPAIKVTRIKDGNHLDRASLEELAELVEEKGYQVFVELVTESPEAGVLFMQEGQVVI